MLSFHDITLEDRSQLLPLLTEKNRGCEYNFANLFLYRDFFETKVSYFEGGAVIWYSSTDKFLFPVGYSDVGRVLDELIGTVGRQCTFVSLSEDDAECIKSHFNGSNITVSDQNDSEYVYLSDDLSWLKGKKYHSKRNFCSRFENACPGYSLEVLGPDNIADAAQMNAAWYLDRDSSDENIQMDYACSTGCLKYFKELELEGALIRFQGRVLAWCCGSMLADGVFCTHVEKAMKDIEGDYAVINRDFARMLNDRFRYINREDDAGDEGIRRAKMSYDPVYMYDKKMVVIR